MTTRIPSAGEKGKCCEQVCSNCKQVEQNRVKCSNIVPLSGASTSVTGPSIESRRRQPRVYSVCGQSKHTRTSCNLYNVDEKINNSFK